MNLHANAKLGLAGRHELVLAIESGVSLKRAAAGASRRRLRIAGGTAGWIEAGRSLRWLIARRGRTASRGD